MSDIIKVSRPSGQALRVVQELPNGIHPSVKRFIQSVDTVVLRDWYNMKLREEAEEREIADA